jgi:multicomponent Na+:H+ antiporter subunit E
MARKPMNRILPDLRDRRAVALKLWQLAWLAVVWGMLWGDLSAPNLVMGLIVGFAVLVLLPLPPVSVGGRVHVLSALRLLGVFLGSMALGSLQVAWQSIRPGPPPMSGVLRARVRVRSDLVLTLMVDTMNLIPGTLVLDLDTGRRLLYVHVLDVSSEKAVRRFYSDTARMENLFIRAFERDAEWHAEPTHPKEAS